MSSYQYSNQALLWLDFKARSHDPVNGWSINRGRAGSDLDAVFGAGAAEPTKLTDRRGYYFDGGDYMQCSAGYQNTTGLLSLTICIRSEFVIPIQTMFGWETVAGDTVGIFQYVSAADQIRFYCGGTAAGNIASVSEPNWGFEDRVHTLCGVYDGTDTILYVDGVQSGFASVPIPPDATSNPMCIGARGNGTSNPWVGDIYHVGMADFAMEADQVWDYNRRMLAEYNDI